MTNQSKRPDSPSRPARARVAKRNQGPELRDSSSRRNQITAAAARQFAEQGFLATTIRDIAREAGILSGSLYHHFDSKESLHLPFRTSGEGYRVNAVGPNLQPGGLLVVTAP